jgi:hypothetical protein
MKCETEDNVTKNHIEFDLIVDVVLILLVGFFGLCGNISAIHRFSHLKKATKFHHLMMLLSIYDLLCISMIVSIFSLPRVSSVYKQSAFYHYFAPVALSLTQVALTGSIYTTLAITIERYLIVCHPFYVISHEWTSKRYILPIVILSIVYNIPKFLELYALPCYVKEISQPSTTSVSNNMLEEEHILKISNFTSSCFEKAKFETMQEGKQHELIQYFILPTQLRLDTDYYGIYGIWMNLIFMGTLPVITLIILNILILKNLITNLKERKEPTITQQRGTMNENTLNNTSNSNTNKKGIALKTKNKTIKPKEIKLATVGLWIVLIFVLCHSFRWVPNFYELAHTGADQPYWVDWFMHLSHFVLVFNSSVNFYIYCLTHLNILQKTRKCFGKKTKYVRTRCASASQSTARRMSALTDVLQTRKTSISSSTTAEHAHKSRLQNIMEEMTESVTVPMLAPTAQTEESDEEYDDEW